MERAVIDPLTTVRNLFPRAGGHPVALAQAVCDLLVAQAWGRAARLRWSPGFAAALADDGSSVEPIFAGPQTETLAWEGARELASGPQAHYALSILAPAPQESTLLILGALVAGLDAWLEAWQRERSMQALLRRSELDRQHYRRLFDTVPVSTAIVAKSRAIIDVNQVFCDRYGMTRDEMIGRNLDQLGIGYVDEDRIRLGLELRATRRVRNMTMRGVRRDGTPGKFLLNAEMTDFDGEDCALVSSMDITDMLAAEAAIQARHQAEADSRLAGEMLADLQRLSDFGRRVTASLDPRVIVDTLRSGLPELLPAEGLRVLMYEHDDERLEPFGEAPAALGPAGDDADPHLRALRGCLDAPAITTLQRADDAPAWPAAPAGARAALVAPLVSRERPIGLLVVYARDAAGVTPTHRAMLGTLALQVAGAIVNSRAYAQLQIAQAQLVEREKMAALGSLVAGVAHELNTPLGNALLLTSTLNERMQALPPAANADADAPANLAAIRQLVTQAGPLIERSLRSAATLVSSFKQVAADQTADRRRSFDLAVLVGEIVATLHGQLQPHHHQLVVTVPPGITMDSHPGALAQVLTNLILNALQHGLAGRTNGRITLLATRYRRDDVLIELGDDGCGISAAHLGRVFDPFFTTRLGQGGTGLGLSVSYNIVTAVLGGTIQASSPAGSGAVFRVVIPRTAPAAPPRTRSMSPAGAG